MFRSALTPEHAEGRWTARRAFLHTAPAVGIRCNGLHLTKTKSPQTNGIFERFHRTVLDEFYRLAFRKKIYYMY
jgi:hypothetical protein